MNWSCSAVRRFASWPAAGRGGLLSSRCQLEPCLRPARRSIDHAKLTPLPPCTATPAGLSIAIS
jgi:hypothetical protein